jgi:hypothetical protein
MSGFGDNNNWFINLRNLRLPHEMPFLFHWGNLWIKKIERQLWNKK